MAGSEILDDTFVNKNLAPVAGPWLALLWFVNGTGDVRKRIEPRIKRCLKLFDRHHGRSTSSDALRERQLFARSLEIVGNVLNLEGAISLFERIIEIDWKAHVELDKEDRYRDHITHPVRVTAIGWWLLHRQGERLLADLAAHYERETRSYCELFRIDISPHTWKAIVEYAWLACGLLHDSVYPLEYHLRAGEKLGRSFNKTAQILTPMVRAFSTDWVQNAVLDPLDESWFAVSGLDLNERFETLCTEERFKHAHAFIGALYHLLSLGPKLHSLQGLVMQLAARAIATHHDKRDKHIVSDKLALLLFTADNLQAWQRPFLHSKSVADEEGTHTIITPTVECDRVKLRRDGSRYIAEFWMNDDPKVMKILKRAPYKWRFDEFRKPNLRVERLIQKNEKFPRIILTQKRCIQPKAFLEFMAT